MYAALSHANIQTHSARKKTQCHNVGNIISLSFVVIRLYKNIILSDVGTKVTRRNNPLTSDSGCHQFILAYKLANILRCYFQLRCNLGYS